jgi:hypothetical protein
MQVCRERYCGLKVSYELKNQDTRMKIVEFYSKK